MFNPPPHIPPRYIYIYGIHVCVSGGGSEWGGGVLLCVTICTCVCVYYVDYRVLVYIMCGLGVCEVNVYISGGF